MREGVWQLVRYGIVGLVTNALMFGSYLLLSAVGVGPKTALTLLYVPGVILGFMGNRTFTFRHAGELPASLGRYLATYAFGYLFSFAALFLFVDVLQWHADLVSLAVIFSSAGILFLLQRIWVFPRRLNPRVSIR
jgi:putative flippase GtrA